MPARNVVLTDHQIDMIERLVSSGKYQNASDVLREGLRLVEQRHAEDEARLTALREAARVGIADLDAGRYRRFETDEELREHLSELTEAAIAAARK